MSRFKILVTLLLSVTVYDSNAQSCGSSFETLDWSTSSWTTGSLSSSYNIASTPISITIEDDSNSRSVIPSTGGLRFPVNFANYFGDSSSAQDAIIMQVDLPTIDSTGTIKVTIEPGVNGTGVPYLDFDLLDIDGEPLPLYRREKLVVNGYLNGAAVSPTLSTTASQTTTADTVWGDLAVASNSNLGTVGVTFNTSVDSVVLVWSITDIDSLHSTSTPGFALHDIRFCPVLVVPVTWLSYDAIAENNHIQIHWSTASEINNSHFEIEIKTPYGWETIGSAQGQGTSLIKSNYNYIDHYANSRTKQTYRIKQVDFNGNYSYTDYFVYTPASTDLNLNCYPNPSSGIIHIDSEEDIQKATVNGIDGSFILDLDLDENNTAKLDLVEGTYILKIQTEFGYTSRRILIIN